MRTIIENTAIALIFGAITFAAFTAHAEPTFQTVAVAVPSADMLEKVANICDGRFVLSEKATVACVTQAFPKLNRDGSAFVNVGIGTELNTLIRQIKPVAAN